MYINAYIYIYIYIHIYSHIYIYTHTCIYVYIFTHLYSNMMRLKRSLCLETQPIWASFQVFWERDPPILLLESRSRRNTSRHTHVVWCHTRARRAWISLRVCISQRHNEARSTHNIHHTTCNTSRHTHVEWCMSCMDLASHAVCGSRIARRMWISLRERDSSNKIGGFLSQKA